MHGHWAVVFFLCSTLVKIFIIIYVLPVLGERKFCVWNAAARGILSTAPYFAPDITWEFFSFAIPLYNPQRRVLWISRNARAEWGCRSRSADRRSADGVGSSTGLPALIGRFSCDSRPARRRYDPAVNAWSGGSVDRNQSGRCSPRNLRVGNAVGRARARSTAGVCVAGRPPPM